MDLARLYEQRVQAVRQAVIQPPACPATTTASTTVAMAAKLAWLALPAPTTGMGPSKAARAVPDVAPVVAHPCRTMRHCYLTSEVMEQRRVAVLCYNYEEKFTSNHYCKHLFLLLSPSGGPDSEDDYDIDDKLGEPGISLYAITCIKSQTS